MTRAENMEALLEPRSIAVIGASPDPARIGGRPIAQMREHGFAGAVYPVNPRYGEVQGHKCFPDIRALPEVPDMVVAALNAEAALDQLETCAAAGVKAAVVFSAGFAELGTPEGVERQDRLRALAERTGIAILGPNCLGVANLRTGAVAAFNLFQREERGHDVALVSQSGAIAGAIYAAGLEVGLGFGHVVTTGNEACLGITDAMEFFVGRMETKVVLLYLEQVRDGARFLSAARALRAQGTLVVALKVGRSAKGQEAAQSHTAALAGNDRAYREAFRAAGVVDAGGIAELVDIAYLHRFGAGVAGPGIALVTASGAAGVAMADGFADAGHPIPTFSAALQERLRGLVPAYGMVSNPVDVTANVVNDPETMPEVVRAVGGEPGIGTVIVYAAGATLMRSAYPRIGADPARPRKLIVSLDALLTGAREAAEAAGMAYFTDIGRAVRAVSAYVDGRAEPAWTPVAPGNEPDLGPVLAEARAAGRGSLSETEGKRLLAQGGIPVMPEILVRDASGLADAFAGFAPPVVLKLVSPDVLHKSEVGGVQLGLHDLGTASAAFQAILSSAAVLAPGARVDGVSVQPQVTDGVEVLIGATHDPVFGWMVTAGLGGVLTEVMADVASRLAPVSEAEAEAMLRSLKGFRLLDGFRGRPVADVQAAASTIAALSRLVVAAGAGLREVEINPLLVRPKGKGVVAADALVTLAPAGQP